MADIPKTPETPSDAKEAKHLSDIQRNRIASSVRGLDVSADKNDQQNQNKEALSSGFKGGEIKRSLDSTEDYSSEKDKDYVEDLRTSHPEKLSTFDALEEYFPGRYDFHKQVLDASTEIPELKIIDEPIIVYRYSDGISGKWVSPVIKTSDRWVSQTFLSDIKERQETLSLPSKGTFADRYELQPGCKILTSFAQGNFHHKGLGEQYFVLDLEKMKSV
jgi:hypothetical protein